jgi:hypothetical protein
MSGGTRIRTGDTMIQSYSEAFRYAGNPATTPTKNIKGRKRHLVVDTRGLPPSVYVTAANV